jgi:hypothetical protein
MDTGGVVAVLAENRDIVHFNLGHGTADVFSKSHPELAGIRLWFGIGCPVVTDMLILAGNLAVVTAITDAYID